MTEEQLSHINEGRAASVTLQWIEPLFQKMEKGRIDTLKSCFRSGNYTELVLACHIAQLCAIDDMRENLKGLSRRAESVSQENDSEGLDHGK